MKFSLSIPLLIAGALISVASGCNEPTGPTQREVVNTAPTASAGLDVWVPVPADSAVLEGSATDAEWNIVSYSWKKVSGPESYSIENPEWAGAAAGVLRERTTVTNLEEGTYGFEFTVTDKGGLASKDTVSIFVYDPRTQGGANEVIFRNQHWQCPMGCTLTIENFHKYVPAGTAIKVFRRSGGSSNWFEVLNDGDPYTYWITDNRLEIYADYPHDEGRAVEVRITF